MGTAEEGKRRKLKKRKKARQKGEMACISCVRVGEFQYLASACLSRPV